MSRDEHADYELPHDLWLDRLESWCVAAREDPGDDPEEWVGLLPRLDPRRLDCVEPIPFPIPPSVAGGPRYAAYMRRWRPGRPDCERCGGTGETLSHGVVSWPVRGGGRESAPVEFPIPCSCTR